MRKLRTKGLVFLGVFAMVLVWFYLFIPQLDDAESFDGKVYNPKFVNQVNPKLHLLAEEISTHRALLKQIQNHLNTLKQYKTNNKTFAKPTTTTTKSVSVKVSSTVIPVLVMACNRPSVSKSLDLLLKYRTVNNFPIIVSQDGGHSETKKVIESYGDKLSYMQHTMMENNIPSKHANLKGYYKLAAHFKWAINEVFARYPAADALIIVEDDLEIAPDFFSYFLRLHDVLLQDETLMCISAWNDNGKENSIDVDHGQTMLYRTDFFPGLGWMLSKSYWQELEPKWPAAFWDDWLREPAQRNDRSCIRPEISRTKTFGRVGVSNGQFYDKHLKFIKLNSEPVDWSKVEVSYLRKNSYDKLFFNKLNEIPKITLQDLMQYTGGHKEVKIEYSSASTFKTIANALGIMSDFKSGVPRTAYQGVVTSLYHNIRVYVTPGDNFKGYVKNWT